jgi:hypothetical protein
MAVNFAKLPELLRRSVIGLCRASPARSHRLHGTGASDGLRARLGQAEVPDLSFPDQIFDGTCDILDRHVRIDTVLTGQVDAIGLQPHEGCVGDFANVRRTAVHSGLPARRPIDV